MNVSGRGQQTPVGSAFLFSDDPYLVGLYTSYSEFKIRTWGARGVGEHHPPVGRVVVHSAYATETAVPTPWFCPSPRTS